MIHTFPDGTIEWFVDQSRPVLFSRWEGDFKGDDLLAAVPAFWDRYPEAAQYGAVHDQIDFTGIIEHRYARATMQMRAERFGPERLGTRTAVVTGDPMKTFDLKVTSVEAPGGRLFRPFSTNASALAWVAADEPGNPSACRDQSGGALPWWFDRTAPAADRAG
jgi:hypothetical protein